MNFYEVTKPLASEEPPALGSLPVEQYLLRNWDANSPLSPTAQRQHLVRAFIQADSVAVAEAERITPSAEQIRTILEPWRLQKLRRLAHEHCAAGEYSPPKDFYFLRTHYAGGAEDDAKLRGWLDLDEYVSINLPQKHEWWVVLDDAELFDLGENEGDWQQVCGIFPELAAPTMARERVEDDIDSISSNLQWLMQEREPEEEDWAEAVRQAAQVSGHKLLVVDRKAFETDGLGLVFRDAKGNVIRQGRVRADELNELVLYESTQGALHETRFWLDSEVGEKYRVGGEVVREIVPLAKAYKASEESKTS